MELLALVSGLIGALVSAALSYWVRAILDRRALRESERRLAYVHFVQVSEMTATDIVVRSFVKAYLPESARAWLQSPDGSFQPSHRISALLAERLQKLTTEDLKAIPGAILVPRLLKSLLETAKETRLSPEQLAKLPQDVVLTYSLFLKYHGYVCQVVELWIAYLEHDDRSWLSAEGVHEHWLYLVRYFEQARLLRAALVRSGAATPQQAAHILREQVNVLNENLASKLTHKPMIEAAVAATKKELGNENAG